MAIDFSKIQIDEELEKLLPQLLEDDYNSLKNSLLENGFDQKFGRIKVWFPEDNDGTGYIVDGHNRYKICRENGVELSYYCFESVFFDSKEEVIKWMLENQLARRNLLTIQRIAVAEKYRPIYEKQAKANQSLGGGDKRSKEYQKSVESDLSQAVDKKRNSTTDEKLSKISGVKTTTYKMGAKVLKSGNDELKKRVLSGKTSISAGYRELRNSENTESKKEKAVIQATPEQKIIEFDNRMNEIDKEISSLRTERESLMRRRSSLFESLDIECELKYEFVITDDDFMGYGYAVRECIFFVDIGGHKQILVTAGVNDESPLGSWSFIMREVPERYKNDFIMLWKKAYYEQLEWDKTQREKMSEKFKKTLAEDDKKFKEFYKQCYKTLAKSVHPDEGGNVEAMQCLNQLKVMWGV